MDEANFPYTITGDDFRAARVAENDAKRVVRNARTSHLLNGIEVARKGYADSLEGDEGYDRTGNISEEVRDTTDDLISHGADVAEKLFSLYTPVFAPNSGMRFQQHRDAFCQWFGCSLEAMRENGQLSAEQNDLIEAAAHLWLFKTHDIDVAAYEARVAERAAAFLASLSA